MECGDPFRLIDVLAKHNVPIVIIGGHAVTYHGYVIFDYIPGYPNESVEELFQTSDECQGRSFASLAWLRKMKTAASRPKDQIDLDNLPADDG